VSSRAIARRYANALFDVAKKAGRLDHAERELSAFAATLDEHEDLRRAFEAPAVPPQKKRALLESLLDRLGLQGEVPRLLRMLADRGRLAQVSDVVAAFADRLRQDRQVVEAHVVTAQPLSDAERASLTRALRQAAGADVALSEAVNPGIMGGLVARVGSLVFDASLVRQLERMKQRLTEQT
jgi:F-type H+-transporting ATPase subunit delta